MHGELLELFRDQIEFLSEFDLNDFELEFVESIENRLDDNKVLTDKQIQKLSEIYNNYRRRS